jgi:AcrR family transcriptional regulator
MGSSATRKYESPQRREQAAATRRRIVEAARRLFSQRGIAHTTLEAVAKAAKVSTPTVFQVFGSKQAIVAAMLPAVKAEVEIGPQFKTLMASSSPREKLAISARMTRAWCEQGADVHQVMREAARHDRSARKTWNAAEDSRLRGQRALVESIASQLRRGVSVEQAADVLFALSSDALYRELVDGRGWTPDAYEAWLAESTARLLLER